MRPLLAPLLAMALTVGSPVNPHALAQVPSQAGSWRAYAERLDAGTRLEVRLRSGQRFSATLVEAREDMLLIQPRTRVPVPIQPIAYDAVLSLEREVPGAGAGRAIAIGIASGVGAFFGVMAILLASIDD